MSWFKVIRCRHYNALGHAIPAEYVAVHVFAADVIEAVGKTHRNGWAVARTTVA